MTIRHAAAIRQGVAVGLRRREAIDVFMRDTRLSGAERAKRVGYPPNRTK
jgi:hypothetical protein